MEIALQKARNTYRLGEIERAKSYLLPYLFFDFFQEDLSYLSQHETLVDYYLEIFLSQQNYSALASHWHFPEMEIRQVRFSPDDSYSTIDDYHFLLPQDHTFQLYFYDVLSREVYYACSRNGEKIPIYTHYISSKKLRKLKGGDSLYFQIFKADLFLSKVRTTRKEKLKAQRVEPIKL